MQTLSKLQLVLKFVRVVIMRMSSATKLMLRHCLFVFISFRFSNITRLHCVHDNNSSITTPKSEWNFISGKSITVTWSIGSANRNFMPCMPYIGSHSTSSGSRRRCWKNTVCLKPFLRSLYINSSFKIFLFFCWSIYLKIVADPLYPIKKIIIHN